MESEGLNNLQRLVQQNENLLQKAGYEREVEDRGKLPTQKKGLAGPVGMGFDPAAAAAANDNGGNFTLATKQKLFGNADVISHQPIHLQPKKRGETDRERRLRERRERFAARQGSSTPAVDPNAVTPKRGAAASEARDPNASDHLGGNMVPTSGGARAGYADAYGTEHEGKDSRDHFGNGMNIAGGPARRGVAGALDQAHAGMDTRDHFGNGMNVASGGARPGYADAYGTEHEGMDSRDHFGTGMNVAPGPASGPGAQRNRSQLGMGMVPAPDPEEAEQTGNGPKRVHRDHFNGMILGNTANPGDARDALWERKRRAYSGAGRPLPEENGVADFAPPVVQLRSPIRPSADATAPVVDHVATSVLSGGTGVVEPVRPRPLNLDNPRSPLGATGGSTGAPPARRSPLMTDPAVQAYLNGPLPGGPARPSAASPAGAAPGEDATRQRKRERQQEYARQLREQMQAKEDAVSTRRRGRARGAMAPRQRRVSPGKDGSGGSPFARPSPRKDPRKKAAYAQQLEEQIRERERRKREEKQEFRRSGDRWRDKHADPDPTDPERHAPQFRAHIHNMYGGTSSWERQQAEEKRRKYVAELDAQVRRKKEREAIEKGGSGGRRRRARNFEDWGEPRDEPPRGRDPIRGRFDRDPPQPVAASYDQAPSRSERRVNFEDEAPRFGRRSRSRGPTSRRDGNDGRGRSTARSKSPKVLRQEAYRNELAEQLREKDARKRRERDDRRRRERAEQEQVYDPWGKGGGGAPMRGPDGRVETNLRRAKKQRDQENLRRSFDRDRRRSFDGGLGDRSPARGGGGGFPPSQPQQRDLSPLRAPASMPQAGGRGISPVRSPMGDPASPTNQRSPIMRGGGLADLGGRSYDASAARRKEQYRATLEQQIRERKARKQREAEEKKRLDEEDEMRARGIKVQRGRRRSGGGATSGGFGAASSPSAAVNAARSPQGRTAARSSSPHARGGGLSSMGGGDDDEAARKAKAQAQYREELKRQAEDVKRRKEREKAKQREEEERLEAKIKRDLGLAPSARGRAGRARGAADAAASNPSSPHVTQLAGSTSKAELFGPSGGNTGPSSPAGGGPVVPSVLPAGDGLPPGGDPVQPMLGGMGGPNQMMGGGMMGGGMGGGMMGGAGAMGGGDGMGGMGMQVLQEVKAMKEEQMALKAMLQKQAMEKLQRESEEMQKQNEKAREELRRLHGEIDQAKGGGRGGRWWQGTNGSLRDTRRVSRRPRAADQLDGLPSELRLRDSVAAQLGVLKDLNIRLDESVIMGGGDSLDREVRAVSARGTRGTRRVRKMPGILEGRPRTQESFSTFSQSLRGGEYPVFVSKAEDLLESQRPRLGSQQRSRPQSRRMGGVAASMKGESDFIPVDKSFMSARTDLGSSLRAETDAMQRVLADVQKSLAGGSELVYPGGDEFRDSLDVGPPGGPDSLMPMGPGASQDVPSGMVGRDEGNPAASGRQQSRGASRPSSRRPGSRRPDSPSNMVRPFTPSIVEDATTVLHEEPSSTLRPGTQSTAAEPAVDIDALLKANQEKLSQLEKLDVAASEAKDDESKDRAQELIVKFVHKESKRRPNSRYKAEMASGKGAPISVPPTPAQGGDAQQQPLTGESSWLESSTGLGGAGSAGAAS